MSIQEKEQPKPKGAMSAYAYFVQVIREEHKRKHPGEHVGFSEFSKKCAEKWKLMTPKEKKRFEEMAANDKDRYNKEMSNYQPKEGVGRRRRKRRRIKEPGQPKRAWSAFFFFCNEYRPKIREVHPEWRVGNIAKELGRLWEGCTNKEKYEKQSEADKQRYEEQMSQYRAGHYVPPVKRPTPDDPGSLEDHVDPNAEDGSEDEEDEGDGSCGGTGKDQDVDSAEASIQNENGISSNSVRQQIPEQSHQQDVNITMMDGSSSSLKQSTLSTMGMVPQSSVATVNGTGTSVEQPIEPN